MHTTLKCERIQREKDLNRDQGQGDGGGVKQNKDI